VSKKALLALLLVLVVPLLAYWAVNIVSKDAVVMPKHFYADSVVTKTVRGKVVSDTVWHTLADFSLTNQLGQKVSLRDSALRGKIIVADFFFTHCPSICPPLTRNMRKMQESLGKHDMKIRIDTSIVHFLSFSVDPKRDSVAALKKWADRFGVDHDSWWLMTGDKKVIYDFSMNELKLGLQDGEGVDTAFIHTDRFVLIDRNHHVRGFYRGLDSADLARLAGDIVLLTLEKDKSRPTVFKKMRAVLPLIIIGIVAAGVFVVVLGWKRGRG
jgi:protein SCO1